MKLKLFLVVTLATLLTCTMLATAQSQRAGGKVFIPDSSMERADQIGSSAHTNIQVFLPAEAPRNEQAIGPPYAGYAYETPASLACVYGLVTAVTGCNPNQVTRVPSGGARMIALVDAYDAPNAASDLAKFSAQFGLPPANFQVVYASGSKPAYDMGWEFEESLDVQWAHAMAPSAKIVLVEVASNSFADLMKAEDVASQMVAAAGGGEVSNSWGGSEFSGETSYDSHFVKAGGGFGGFERRQPRLIQKILHLRRHVAEARRHADDDGVVIRKLRDCCDRRGLIELEMGFARDLVGHEFRDPLDHRLTPVSRTPSATALAIVSMWP